MRHHVAFFSDRAEIRCDDPGPSYQAQVSSIIQTRCVECHNPDGVAATRDYTRYEQVFANRSAILSEVYSCFMPPPGATPLTMEERAGLLNWLVCGAPNN